MLADAIVLVVLIWMGMPWPRWRGLWYTLVHGHPPTPKDDV